MRSSNRFSASAPLIAALLLAVACGSGSGGSGSSGGAVTVSGAWARATVSVDQPDAAYLIITNTSGQADALLSVTSPTAASVQMHETSMDSSGMMGMHPISRIDVAAGATVTLQPGGLHMMLVGLAKALQPGDSVELDLVFEHAGKVVVQAGVRQG